MTRNRDVGLLSSAFCSMGTFLAGNRRCKSVARRPGFRSLRIERCEPRNLLAVVAGTVFEDLTGDGYTADDVPFDEPVTIELFEDTDGDGQFGDGIDQRVDFQTTDPGMGQYGYSFDVSVDGRYFVRQVGIPPSSQQTTPPDVYTVDVAGAYLAVPVDDFQAPAGAEIFVIDFLHDDPVWYKTVDASILGGDRDLLIDVIGAPIPFSAQVEIGNGHLVVATEQPGTRISLRYDGENDAGFDPWIDLTGGGKHTGFLFDMDWVDSGAFSASLDLQVFATSFGGGWARILDGEIPDHANPNQHFVPFASFDTGGGFSFTQTTSLEFVFNPDGDRGVDFSIDGVSSAGSEELPFANVKLSSLSGFVYVDINDDGFKAPSELPIPNTTVTLIGIDDRGNPVNRQTTTDAAGFYSFTDLWPSTLYGGYTIRETQPAAYLDGRDTIGTPGGTTSDDQFSAILLPGDFHGEDNNFGELGLKPDLSGFVYVDINDDGFKAPSELPIPNTTVTLIGIDDRGNPVNRQTTTDAAGFYSFTDLWPSTLYGGYTIRETQPAAYLDGRDTIGTPGGTTSDDQFSAILLPADFHGEDNNFGELGLKPEYISKRLFIYPYGDWPYNYDGRGETPADRSSATEGGPGDNLIEFVAKDNPGFGSVYINGELQPLGPETGVFHYDGIAGNDTVVLSGSDGDDTLVLGPDYAMFVGDTFAVTVVNVESITVDGRGGSNTATIYDSAGNDTLEAFTTRATLTGPGFSHGITEFATLRAYATAGGFDVAKLHDSPGNDNYAAHPTHAALSGDGFDRQVESFEAVHAYATGGGFDVAKLYDSSGNDTFVADPIQGMLFGSGYFNRAKFFEGVHAYAIAGGFDVAKLHDSSGDDTFFADPIQGMLFGSGYYNRAKFFEGVHAYAIAGGDDVAELTGSAGDDVFRADPLQSALYGTGFFNRAKYFEKVFADAGADGHDEAFLDDSDSIDYLLAEGDFAQLASSMVMNWPWSFGYRATGFDRVRATASTAGDKAQVAPFTPLAFILELDGPWSPWPSQNP